MATKPATMEYLLDQLSGIDGLTTRRMFGEYALYRHGKVIAFVCDDTLFLKPTAAGKEFAGKRYRLEPAYPGSKPYFAVDAEFLEDRPWLAEAVRVTDAALPAKKEKKKGAARKSAKKKT